MAIGGAASVRDTNWSDDRRLLPPPFSFQYHRNGGVRWSYRFVVPGPKRPRSRSLGAITVALIIVISTGNPELSPFANAALRFSESVIGAAIAVLAVLLWLKTKEAT